MNDRHREREGSKTEKNVKGMLKDEQMAQDKVTGQQVKQTALGQQDNLTRIHVR